MMSFVLARAISEGDLPGVKLLIEGRANIADYSALELAVITGDIAIVEWLPAGRGLSKYFRGECRRIHRYSIRC
jgi:hypothetical protein